MKRNGIFWLGLLSCTTLAAPVLGVTNPGNPYAGIVGRNAFALKPATPQNIAPPQAPTLPTKIFLQGITTILNQKQVFLKIQPPPPGKEVSTVLAVGQREGDVEVLEINHLEGVVKINNSGAPQTLTMENDAAHPTASAAMPIPGVPLAPAPGMPGLPTPRPATPPPAVTTFGGASKILPTRSVRSQVGSGIGQTGTAGIGGTQNLPTPTLEEQSIMMEVQREITAREVEAGTMPPLPPTEFSAPPTPPTP